MIALPTKKPDLKTVTGSQSSTAISIQVSGGKSEELDRTLRERGTYTAYRGLRSDPTIALGRGLLISGILAGAWGVEADKGAKEEAIAAIKGLLPIREQFLQTAIGYGAVDFGWQGYEKIFCLKGGRIVLDRLKPLLHDLSTILVDAKGNFRGYRQRTASSDTIDVPLEKALHIVFDAEGGNLYGTPLLENVRATAEMWDDCNDGAKKYDKKIAGSHFVVHYPPGTTTVNDEVLENSVVANRLLVALESSGSMALPSTTAEYVEELIGKDVSKLYQWDITLLSDASPRQPSFIERLKYLDSLKVRGMIFPERAITEGQFGTKAESEVHLGLALAQMEKIDRIITRQLNDQLVNQLLLLNFGDDAVGSVRLVSSPLVDKSVEFLQDLYVKVFSTPDGIDVEALREQLSIPKQETKQEGK